MKLTFQDIVIGNIFRNRDSLFIVTTRNIDWALQQVSNSKICQLKAIELSEVKNLFGVTASLISSCEYIHRMQMYFHSQGEQFPIEITELEKALGLKASTKVGLNYKFGFGFDSKD